MIALSHMIWQRSKLMRQRLRMSIYVYIYISKYVHPKRLERVRKTTSHEDKMTYVYMYTRIYEFIIYIS